MYKIAICDDDKRYRKTIREIVEHENSLHENEIRFYEYESGNELLKHTDILHELVFIDIRMPGLDGNQTALKLRNYNKDAVLIFCSSYFEPTVDSINFGQPFRYIMKDLHDTSLRREIAAIMTEVKRRFLNDYAVTVTSAGKIIRIHVENILYVSRAKRGCVITIVKEQEKETVRCRESFGELCEGILFTLSYIKELFDEDVVNGIVDVFITILTMFGNKDKELFEMTDIPLAIRDSEIIKKLNDTTEISSSISFREKLKKNCEIYAEKYAFIDEQSHMTYQELKEFSDKLNFILLKKYSLKHGDKVGLYLPKGVEQAACEVALAYLNIVFLPIDVEFPVKIVEHCVSAIGLRMILTDTKEHMEDIAAVTTTIVTLENEIPSAEIGKEALEENSETMLINTSGTTGMPKTVILTWRGIMNCINATQKLFSITSKDVAFGVTNYGHDMSIFDILGMVYIGGTTVIPNQHNYKNPEIWIDLMNKYKVTVWISVPALLEMLLYSDLEKLPEVVGKLHRVIQGGDYLHIDIVKKFRKWNQKGKIFNVGGPTETTMWNIYHEVSGEDIQNNNIPYGKPFPNTQYYILDKKQELCPVGKEGQMYIAGDGVTPGYVGTGEQGKFTEYKGLRVYCSGDYGVYMRTGEILFRGRKDRQIKINGKRIELDGIEEKLNSIKGITKGAVICKDKRIVAYYVAEDKTEVNNIKKILSGILPEYMIPTAFYEIKRLPYNRNKKVDYRELERMVPKTGEQEKAETELEDFVARICENIFEVEKIGVKESFYNLGGDSVTAMRIAAIIKKEFNVHMTPYDIFEHSTIRELASYIAKLRSDINEKV